MDEWMDRWIDGWVGGRILGFSIMTLYGDVGDISVAFFLKNNNNMISRDCTYYLRLLNIR